MLSANTHSVQFFKGIGVDDLIVSTQCIPRLLAPYSWNAKMRKCSEYASKAFNGGFVCNVVNAASPLPWEMNIFVALATIYADGPIDEIPDPIFRLIINTIRTATPLRLYTDKPDIKDYIACEIASVQIPYQQNQLVLLFRYKFMYTYVDEKLKINMPRVFQSRFGIEGDDIFLFILLAHMATVEGKYWILFIHDFCERFACKPNKLFEKIVDLFAIERIEFSREQKKLFDLSTDGYFNANILLEKYPFVKMKDAYSLPLPYLLSMAGARHLFDRLMPTNDELRAKIGGPLLEAYVYDLFVRAACYDVVEKQFKYRVNRYERESPDVIVRKGSEYLFLEVKLSEAPIELRQMFPSTVSRVRKANANHIYQLFLRINELCNGVARHKMNPSRVDVYGVVVVHEDAYLVRDDIYEECFQEHPELTNCDKEFIKKQISMVGLYAIEQYCYGKCNIFEGLRMRKDDGRFQISYNLHVEDLCKGRLNLPMEECSGMIQELPIRLFDAA